MGLAAGRRSALLALLVLVSALSACGGHSSKPRHVAPPPPPPAAPAGIHKIRHVVVIMQENRSFDSSFGTFPGADGIPRVGSRPTVCVPDPRTGSCLRPFHDRRDRNAGGPHGVKAAVADTAGGSMSGFVAQEQRGRRGCAVTFNPECGSSGRSPDVMGYHNGSDIPNYWRYARDFVLQDHMFEPNASWSLPQHLFMVSEWSALCSRAQDPTSCRNELQNPANPPDFQRKLGIAGGQPPDYAWTDLTYMLHKQGVSWG